MGKKKKGGKGKGGDGGDKKLPPPPNLDNTRDGAHEALLKFQIHGKEEMIDQFEEEAEVFKDRNDHQKERNHVLLREQETHYKGLVQQARDYELDLHRSQAVAKEEVEEALVAKIQFAQQAEQALADLEHEIHRVHDELEYSREELTKWQAFRDVTQHKNSAYISSMKEKMEEMRREAAQLKADIDSKLAHTKDAIDQRSEVIAAKQRDSILERLMEALDEESRAEITDNVWLKKEISIVCNQIRLLREVTDAMETRNLELMETSHRQQMEELEATRELYHFTTRKRGRDSRSSGSSLPSLVDIGKCTSEEGPGGQLGQFELNLLSIHGAAAPFSLPPEVVHLPPIEEQKSCHSALPPRTSWPVTGSMLQSVG